MSDFDTVRAALDRIEAMMRARTIEKPVYRELTCDDHRGKDYSEETLLCQWCYREQAEAELTRLREALEGIDPGRCPLADQHGKGIQIPWIAWANWSSSALTQENNDD